MNWQSLTPPVILNLARRYLRPYGYRGSYADWQSAQRAAGGYDTAEILSAATASMRLVRDGKAAGERDGKALDCLDVVWPIVGVCLRAAADAGGRVTVLDFGGGLGGSYYQHRAMLEGVQVDWVVVEQANYVAVGKREFTTETLSFSDDLGAVLTVNRPTVALLSSVLQYLPSPVAVLESIIAAKPAWVLLDRTPFSRTAQAQITVQTAHPSVYVGSYPAWLLSFPEIDGCLRHGGYAQVSEFKPFDHDYRADYRGLVYRLQAV